MTGARPTARRVPRAGTVVDLAPVAPPCFSSRDQWTEYVAAAAVDQRLGHTPGPLVLAKGEPVRFNPNFDLCADCTDRHEGAMRAQGRCQPRYLIELFAAKPLKESA